MAKIVICISKNNTILRNPEILAWNAANLEDGRDPRIWDCNL